MPIHFPVASRRRFPRSLAAFALALNVMPAAALTFYADSPAIQAVGHLRTVSAQDEDTLMDIARRNGVGYQEMRLANPGLSVWVPGEGNQVVIPGYFLLPDAPREGIVLNRSEMRLYYFHPGPDGTFAVSTYPVGIGRADRQTPLGRGEITMKLQNPTWYPTQEVLADYAARGKSLARSIPAGPDNPLGEYAMMLDLPGYMIHGTNRPDGVGMLVSQGCVRLYPEDIAALVGQVERGTQVTIVDQPVKVALVEGQLFAEIHPPVYNEDANLEQMLIQRVIDFMEQSGQTLAVDWQRVRQVAEQANGMPAVIGGLAISPDVIAGSAEPGSRE